MNRKLITLSILTGAVALLAIVGIASAQSPAIGEIASNTQAFIKENLPFEHRGGPRGPRGGHDRRGEGLIDEYMAPVIANILGISVDELETARENRTSLSDLIEAAGLTMDKFQSAVQTAVPDAVNQALEDGAITQTQADRFLEKNAEGIGLFGRRGQPGDGPLAEYMQTAVAEVLGITPDELTAAREAKTPLSELLDTAGLTVEEFRTALQTAKEEAIAQAIEEGVITEEQGQKLLEHQLHEGFHHPRNHRPHHNGGFQLDPETNSDPASFFVSEVTG